MDATFKRKVAACNMRKNIARCKTIPCINSDFFQNVTARNEFQILFREVVFWGYAKFQLDKRWNTTVNNWYIFLPTLKLFKQLKV